MKRLRDFVTFDWDKFIKGKKLAVVEITDNEDFETKEHLGSKVKVVIVEDKTAYSVTDGKPVSNKYETITLKCTKDIDLPADTMVIARGVTASVYGDYNNKLSVHCDDVIAVGGSKEQNNA